MKNSVYGRMYEIREDYDQLLEYLYNNEYDLPILMDDEATIDEIDKEIYKDIFRGMEFELTDIAETIGKILVEIEGDAMKLKVESTRLKEKAEEYMRKSENLKLYLKETMEHTGQTKLKGDLFQFSVCKNGGKQGVEYDENIDNIPNYFRKEKRIVTVDVDKIREALLNGEKLGFAELKARGTHLRIK